MKRNIWICVYRDTIEEHDASTNLSEILVTEDFAKQYFEECIVPNCEEEISFDTWYNDEYTADETEDFYQYAKEHNAILDIEHWKYKEEFKMKYNKEEQMKINDWLESVGVEYLKNEEFFEYKDGQLLEIAEAKEDSIFTWDEWQHVQALMGMEIPLDVSIRIVSMLWENDIEIRELKTDSSEKYYKKLKELQK